MSAKVRYKSGGVINRYKCWDWKEQAPTFKLKKNEELYIFEDDESDSNFGVVAIKGSENVRELFFELYYSGKLF